jgi:hypothetical protein
MLLCWWAGIRLLKSYRQDAIRRCAERRHDCANDEPADVVGRIPRWANGF